MLFPRLALSGLLAAQLGLAAENYLLIDQAGIEAARRKAEKQPWARRVLDRLLADAEKALKAPLRLPERGGQWPHWYSCKKDGVRLETVSATEHRCPACGATYRGDPYDAVVIYGEHSRYSRAVRDLGLAYRFTSRAAFARRAGEILLGYAERYRTYPRHNVNGEDKVGGGRTMAQTLDESVWLIPLAWGYSLVRDTLEEPERRRIETDLVAAAAEVIREHRMGIHNIQCWKNTAVGLAGFLTGNKELVREAIDDPERGFRAQIARGATDDGLWWEGSLGYHRYTMQALWPLAEAARLAGIDLYSDRYRSLYDAPLALALPDGDPPGFNDSAGSNVATYGRLVSHTTRESLEALLWGAETVPSGPMIPNESVLMRTAGYAMLRSPAMTVAARFGMHGGGHGHPDKLNIVTFGAGQLWGLDPGSINYGVPLHREWYRSTIAHNTVSVDQRVQGNTDGRLEKWADGTLVAVADSAYPGVVFRRHLTLRGHELIDRFECSSQTGHTYDWAFHAPGVLTTSVTLSPHSSPLGEANGYQHIEKVAAGRADGDWEARWQAGAARLTVRFKGEPGTEILTGAGPGKNPAERVPLLIVRRRAARTVFEAVHRIEAGKQQDAAKEAVFKMPKDRDVFFRNYCYTGSAYVQFGRTGSYSRIAREHMFVEEIDRGTWTQAETGEITLISKWHKFSKDPETNPFHLTPMTYRGVRFLLWKDSETPVNRDLTQIKQMIDGRTGNERLAYFYVEIDGKTFQQESTTTQEFIFYPQMNRRARQK